MSQKHLGAHPKCLGNGWLAAQNVQRHFWNAPGYFENASRTIPGPKKRPNGALASPPPPCGVFGGLENVLEAFSKCPRSLKKCFWTFWVAPQPFPGHRSARIFFSHFYWSAPGTTPGHFKNMLVGFSKSWAVWGPAFYASRKHIKPM